MGYRITRTCFVSLQEEDKVKHILTQCVLAREVWVQLLAKLNIATLAPTRTVCRLESWWHVTRQVFCKKAQRNFDAVVILGSW
jgi:hypothetical protein